MALRTGLLLAALQVALALPAVAAPGWLSYLNQRYGYEAMVPPGFDGLGESDAGDGQVFRRSDGRATLTVWGGYLAGGPFADETASRLADLKSEGWTITYEASTPGWASYSGTKGQRVVYFREIAGCKSSQFAAARFEYPAIEITAMNAVVTRVAAELSQKVC